MSKAIVTVVLHLERHDHSRKLDDETALSLIEGEVDGMDLWDDDYKYEVHVISAHVDVNASR